MTPLVLTLLVAAVAVLWPAWAPMAFLCALAVAVVVGATRRARSGTPATIRRLPTRHEQRHWRLGLGLAFGFHGVFPFIWISRRLR